MKKGLLLLIVALIYTFNCISQETNYKNNINKMILEYSDGNGNYYKITMDSVFYEPVKRKMSSSGIYNGGEAKNNKISGTEFKLIYKKFEAIFKNISIQIPNRVKTSGRLKLSEGSEKKVIIIKKSEEQKQLESILNKLLE